MLQLLSRFVALFVLCLASITAGAVTLRYKMRALLHNVQRGAVLMCVALLLLPSLAGADSTTYYYSVVVNSSLYDDSWYGSVTRDPVAPCYARPGYSCFSPGYPRGTSVSLTAHPKPGYKFTGWTGDCTGTANPCTVVVMFSDRIVTPHFALIPPTPVNPPTTVIPPASVTPQSGWWWNPNESGRGFAIEISGNNLFMAGFNYAEGTGQANWFFSNGSMSSSSTYQGSMLVYGRGQTLTGNYVAPTPTSTLGTVSLKFSDATHGTISWPGVTIPIERFNIAANGVNAPRASFQPETGWWWNPNESGRGFALEIQNGKMFLAGYMYDSSGNPIWYLTENLMAEQNRYQGNWMEYADGQTLMGAYRAPTVYGGPLCQDNNEPRLRG